jgi:hypothetical protein
MKIEKQSINKRWSPHKPIFSYINKKKTKKSGQEKSGNIKFSDKFNEYGIGFDVDGNFL